MRLKELRKEKGVTQKEVADYIYCNTITYSRYERGLREPNIQTLRRLAEYFQVTIDYLIGDSK